MNFNTYFETNVWQKSSRHHLNFEYQFTHICDKQRLQTLSTTLALVEKSEVNKLHVQTNALTDKYTIHFLHKTVNMINHLPSNTAFIALTLLLGLQEGHPAFKKNLEQGANDLYMVQLMPLPPHHLLLQQNPEWFTFLMLAYPGCPGIKAVKQM